jgi:hypothetical protein
MCAFKHFLLERSMMIKEIIGEVGLFVMIDGKEGLVDFEINSIGTVITLKNDLKKVKINLQESNLKEFQKILDLIDD